MEHIGIDVHKMHSQICILTEDGELIERQIRMGAPAALPRGTGRNSDLRIGGVEVTEGACSCCSSS